MQLRFSIRDLLWLTSSSAIAVALWIGVWKRALLTDLICFAMTVSASAATGVAIGSLFGKKELLSAIGLVGAAWLYIMLFVLAS